MTGPAELAGKIPSGEQFQTVIHHDLIALRVGDRVCVAHPSWMTNEQAERMARAVLAVTSPEQDEQQQAWKCEDCGWQWPLPGVPVPGAECDNCGGELAGPASIEQQEQR